MRKLLYAATVVGACLLPAGMTQAQCPCGYGYYGHGPAYYGAAALPPTYYGYPAPAYHAYGAMAYAGYEDGVANAYYRGWGGYGIAGASMGLRNYGYGYGVGVGLGPLTYGHRPFGVGRTGWHGGYAIRHSTRKHAPTPPPPATFDLKDQRPTQQGGD
jgi:hypothetical protein